jgi:signal peptidase I
MGYFDEDNNTEETSESSGVEALLESDEDKAARKAREKEEKAREKELRKIEKLEKKRQKRKEKGLFVEDIQDKQQKISDKISGKKADTVEAAEDTVSEASEAGKHAEKAVEETAKEAAESVSAAAADIKNASDNSENSGSSEGEVSGSETDSDSDSDTDSESNEPKKKKKVSRRKAKKAGEKVDPKDVNIVRDLLSLLIYIGIVVLICFLITQFVGRRTSVHGSSMEPTLSNDDSLWINLLSYRFGDPERYDIIVFPYADDVHYIKRIIGLPGETVQIAANGDILINGEVLEEPNKFSRMVNPGIASTPITLGPDEYFVLGDNRNNSRDSRYSDVGNIKREKILGKAVFRLTPFKKFGSIYK